MRQCYLTFSVFSVFFFIHISLSIPCLADIKIIVAEATYLMGDGETPASAEARVLQEAKRQALEQAGTYVQVYTRLKNFSLTDAEITTVAGGLIQVIVLDSHRKLLNDGLQFSTKIEAKIRTDNIEAFVKKIRDRNIADQYVELQQNYQRLKREVDELKKNMVSPQDTEKREALLDQLRKKEQTFVEVIREESRFFRHLEGGQLFSKALRQLNQKQNEREMINTLVDNIIARGFEVKVGGTRITYFDHQPTHN